MDAAHCSDKEGRIPSIPEKLSPQRIQRMLAIASISMLLELTMSLPAVAQWLPDQRLTNDSAASVFTTTTSKAIAVNGDSLSLVWRERRDGNNEIYFKHSRDGGRSWGPDIRLTHDTANSSMPCIAVQGPNIHVAWTDPRDGNAELYYLRSSTAASTGAARRASRRRDSGRGPHASQSPAPWCTSSGEIPGRAACTT